MKGGIFAVALKIGKTAEQLGAMAGDLFFPYAIRTIVAIDVHKKVFDSVHHVSIIGEASRLGIPGRTLNFIKGFLEGRTFSVRCGTHDSEPKANRVGVPQGSVLSPTLFNLAMVALPDELSNIPGLGFTVYADDIFYLRTRNRHREATRDSPSRPGRH